MLLWVEKGDKDCERWEEKGQTELTFIPNRIQSSRSTAGCVTDEMSFSVVSHFAVKILNTKTQKYKNAKYCLQFTDNQCDTICVILRTFGKGAKWGVLRGWFRLFADGWPLIFVTICQRTRFVLFFGQGAFCLAPAPLQFQWKSFSDCPTPFFIAGFSFWFRQKNKRTHFLLWPLAFGC